MPIYYVKIRWTGAATSAAITITTKLINHEDKKTEKNFATKWEEEEALIE